MYSRAERKFLNPEKDQANPLLGPGCYTMDETVLVTGKLFGKSGYAPFSSLAPRVSFFDQQVSHGPPPGNYELSLGMGMGMHESGLVSSALFGRSKDKRFKNIDTATPGPGAYVIPSAITLKKVGGKRGLVNGIPKNIASFGLTHRPVTVDLDSVAAGLEMYASSSSLSSHLQHLGESEVPGAESQYVDGERVVAATSMSSSKSQMDSPHTRIPSGAVLEEKSSNASLTSLDPDQQSIGALIATKVETRATTSTHTLPTSKPTTTATTTSITIKKPRKTLVWKRKHVPPSIPAGTQVHGYKESPTGELSPRRPPPQPSHQPPSFLFSFAEMDKYRARGHAFAKGSTRLVFKNTSQGPGPNTYDPGFVGGGGGGGRGAAALIAVAPCVRVTDEIITMSTKQGVPGPGAYQIKAPISAKLAEPRNRIRFGAGKGTGYLNPDLMKIPGPGAYFPENSLVEKPHSKKPKPFGSTTKRFQDSDYVASHPSVGSYEVDEIDSIYQNVKKKTTLYAGQPRAVFGSVADRFIAQKIPRIPGPGAYELDHPMNPKNITPGTAAKTVFFGEEATKTSPFRSGEEGVVVHAPVFGSQTNRFQDKFEDIPPPGAYNVSESFMKLNIHTSGRAGGGLLSSQAKRDIFKVKESIPGPGEYNVKDVSSTTDKGKNVGAFLSTGTRFTDKYERLPGPGAYLNDQSGLLKKTFNTTLGHVVDFHY